jgi:hypothetical protein
MDAIALILTGLMTLISPVGAVGDRLAETQIRKQLAGAESLQVRLDNAPTYQILQGKGDRLRLSGRGLFPIDQVRLDQFELETDPIDVSSRLKLEAPLRSGIKVRVREADINRALQSPRVVQLLTRGARQVSGDYQQTLSQYDFLRPQVKFLGNQRFRLNVTLRDNKDGEELEVQAEATVGIVRGRQLDLQQVEVTAGGSGVPNRLLQQMIQGIRDNGDLKRFEADGLTARVLQWRSDQSTADLALFIQVLPDSKFAQLGRRKKSAAPPSPEPKTGGAKP